MSSVPRNAEVELSSSARDRLEVAQRKLIDAVTGYQQFTDPVLDRGGDALGRTGSDLSGAQRAVEQAELELWEAREELLGWSRPTWAPSALFAADWFSDEDAVYDEPNPTPTR